METLHIYLGKLSYFTNLNTSAIEGMISLYFRHGSRVREDSEVAIKFRFIINLFPTVIINHIVIAVINHIVIPFPNKLVYNSNK